MIRNIIFDWSGTLVDDLPVVLKATNHVLEQCGVETMSRDKFRQEFCLPFKHFYDRFVPDVPMAQLEKTFHGFFDTIQHDIEPLTHAREFLEFCRKHKIKTFILSTVQPAYFKTQADVADFAQFVDKPYLGVWDKRAVIRKILDENQLAANETLFIGDMQHDIDTAKYGGVHSCGVLTGYNRLEQLRASEPDVIVEHLGELQQILDQNQFELRHRKHGIETDPIAHPICTVGAAIFDREGKVLMIRTQKWSNLWGIPGGKIKFGEPSPDALKREIKEETNLDVRDIEFVIVQDCIHSKEFYREAHFVLLNYLCRVEGPCDVTLNEEAEEFKWVTMDEALKMELNQPTRILLEAIKTKSIS